MSNLLDKVRGWWRPAVPTQTVPFEVLCPCGQTVSGRRQPHHQEVRCPGCHRNLFVLPVSPLPAPRSASWSGRRGIGQALAASGSSRPTPTPPSLWKFWRWPLLAAPLTLVLVSAGLIVLLPLAGQRPPPTAPVVEPDLQALIEEGENALVQGQFQLAAERFQQAVGKMETAPSSTPIREVRRFRGLERQAKLLDELLSEPLADIVHQATVDEKQWPTQFARRYRGKSVVFDADVRRDAAGQYRLGYHVQVGDQTVRIDLGDLRMMEPLPLQKPTRLLFGARLKSVAREAGGLWVVRFEPDSGVLLTDQRAVEASCPPPFDDEMKQLLERQAAWAAELP